MFDFLEQHGAAYCVMSGVRLHASWRVRPRAWLMPLVVYGIEGIPALV